MDHPTFILSILGKSLPNVVGYFISLLVTMTLAGLPMILLRGGALIRFLLLKSWFREKDLTRREIEVEFYGAQVIMYGWEYPTMLLVIVICFTYACISPIILPVGAFYFLGAFVVYKKQVLFVYTPQYESGGSMFPSVCDRTLFGLICGQVTLIGYCLLREGFYQSLMIFPLPFWTFSMLVRFRGTYANASKQLNLERAIKIDGERFREQFRDDFYHQPIRTEKIAEPSIC